MIVGAVQVMAIGKSGMMRFVVESRFISNSIFHFFLAAFFLSQTGCLGTYLVKSGYGQMKLLSSREDIDEVLADPKTSPEVKQKLQLAVQARDFSVSRLGLKASKNYKTFVNLDRPFVSYIVFAAKKNAMVEHKFSYPMVGKLPYKGFFNLDDAKEEAKEFPANEYDVIVRGVSAYSTLGWFNDPLLSSMIDTDDADLVNLIIHESTHATLYIKSQAAFNERLATFIGNLGTEIYYKEKEGENSPTLQQIREERADIALFSAFISEQIKDLKLFYEQNKNLEMNALLLARAPKFEQIKEKFKKEIKPKLKTNRYEKFGEVEMNNATLLYQKTYVYDMSDFEKAYKKVRENFPDFLRFCKSLEQDKNPELALKNFVSDPTASK